MIPWLRTRRRRIVCRDAVELMTDYLEGALAAPDADRFARHLAGCDACTAYLAQMRTTINVLGRLRPQALPEPVRDGLIDVYHRYHERD